MNKYLIEILKIRTSVILPGLGGFMIANSKTGKIIINKHLKFDDGILATFIAEKEGIDKVEAKNMVSKFVREIEAELDKGESYDIYQFGKITKGEKGDLIFDMDESLKKETTTPIVTSPKKESVKTDPKKEDKVENTFVPPVKDKKVEQVKKEVKKDVKEEIKTEVPKKDDVKNTYTPPVVKGEKSTTSDKKVDSKKESKEDIAKVKKEAKALADKKKIEEKALAAKKKKEEKDLAAKKKAEAKEKAAALKKEKAAAKKKGKAVVVLDENGKPKKKKRKIIPIIIILLLIGGLGTGGYLYQNKIKEMIGYTSVSEHKADETAEEHEEHHTDEETVEEHITDNDEVTDEMESDSLSDATDEVEENTDVEEVVEEQVQEEVVTNVQSSVNGSYHIIGGGFGEESNANRYAEKNGGIVLGRFDNLYLVALKSYDSRADAQADLSNLKSVSSGAWIFKYSK